MSHSAQFGCYFSQRLFDKNLSYLVWCDETKYAGLIDASVEPLKIFEFIESKGVKVYVEPTATMFLVGSEMDYSTDKMSSRFVFNK